MKTLCCWILLLLVGGQFCPAQVPKDWIMKFAAKPLNEKQVALTIRKGNVENERMIQVTLAAGEDRGVVLTKDVLISALDDHGHVVEVTKLDDVTLVHPHEPGTKGEQWASYSATLKDGQNLSSVTVSWKGSGQKFAMAEGTLDKEAPRK